VSVFESSAEGRLVRERGERVDVGKEVVNEEF
jgi:hypothetical protein